MTQTPPNLRELLTDLSGSPEATDLSADLRRGRRALSRRRTRIAAAVSGTGVAAAAAWSVLPGDAGARTGRDLSVATDGGTPSPPEVTDKPAPDTFGDPSDDSGPPEVQHDLFTYPALGHGYTETDDQGPAVQFTQPGQKVKSYLDSPVLMLEDKSFPMNHGEKVEYDGATFFDQHDQPVSIVNYQLDSGDWLQLQYPLDSGLTQHEVYDFLLAVKVKPGAQGAVG